MKALIDAHMLGAGETGNETYIRGLLRGLLEIDSPQVVAVRESGLRPLAQDAAEIAAPAAPPTPSTSGHDVRLLGGSDVRRLLSELPALARASGADLVHCTYIAPPRSPVPTVVTVHDVSFLRHPQAFTPRDRALLGTAVPYSARRAAAVIVPSEHARAEVVELLRVPEERVFVTPEACGPEFRPPAWAASPGVAAEARHPGAAEAVARPAAAGGATYSVDGLSRDNPLWTNDLAGVGPAAAPEQRNVPAAPAGPPYVLSLGNLQPRKNLPRLLEAWRRLRHAGGTQGHRLVLAGGTHGRKEPVAKLVADLGLSDEVLLPGFVPAEDLPALYAGASVFVYPSLYEGFGLPLLEAMACGTAVASSNAASLPEVAGDAALLFDPLDPDAIAAALGALLEDDALRSALAARGRSRAATFTWAACARATLTAYERALG